MKKSLLCIFSLANVLCSCSNFLNKEPLDAIPTNRYLLVEGNLAAYSANLYNQLSSHAPRQYSMGVFTTDSNGDNQTASNPNSSFVKGETRIAQNGGIWDFGKIRNVNYFINEVHPRLEAGELSGAEANNMHYLGETYFFRTYIYYTKLVVLGDFPILEQWISEDYEAVREAGKRRPRNEMVRFILQDLDSAYYYMETTAPISNRLNEDCAALLKGRVTLFEDTQEKYYKGTTRIPGGPGWPGAEKDYLRGFTIGIDSEIKLFLAEAKEAAQVVADEYPLFNDYPSLFSGQSLSNASEVLLWRAYNASLTPSVNHFIVGYIQRSGGGNTGWACSMMRTYLMENGLPIYADSSGYQGDKSYEAIATDHDPRLIYSTSLPDDLLPGGGSSIEYLVKGYGYYYCTPIVFGQNENKCPTGHSIKKGLTTDTAQGPIPPSTTACVVFRVAGAYLSYMEADYELDNSLDASSDKYWKALRSRAGTDTDYWETINATDLSKELDFACYSGSEFVSDTLYNIRRKRRIESTAEGLRLNDLRRWRALDMMQNYHIEGLGLWNENYQHHTTPNLAPTADVILSVINLIESGNANANVSTKLESQYLCPYRINANNIIYNDYNWSQNKYLNPIAFNHFRLTTVEEGSTDYTTSTIYQNPGWKIETSSLPDGN